MLADGMLGMLLLQGDIAGQTTRPLPPSEQAGNDKPGEESQAAASLAMNHSTERTMQLVRSFAMQTFSAELCKQSTVYQRH